MNNPIIERIQREAGVPELVDVLVERLDPTDLQSLLLEVYRRRAAKVSASRLLDQYAGQIRAAIRPRAVTVGRLRPPRLVPAPGHL